MKVTITLGLDNYNGSLGGFNFVSSVATMDVDENNPMVQRQISRIIALFPGTTVEKEPSVQPKLEESIVASRVEPTDAEPVVESTDPVSVAADQEATVTRKRRRYYR